MTNGLEEAAVAGFDCHKDAHAMCLMDGLGRVVRLMEVPADSAGYEMAERALGGPGRCSAVGIEGTSDYGAGLARHLLARGYRVVEVLRPKRPRRRPGEGKSDSADAERAARDVLSGAASGLAKPKDGWAEDLRCLTVARERHVRASTAAMNALKGLVVSAPDPVRDALRGLGAAELARRCAQAGGEGGLWEAMASLASLWISCKAAAKALEARMARILEESAPALLAVDGCGALSAARLAAAVGDDPSRIRGEAAFASMCGACPVEASSGKVRRHRLNRGGDRQANRALHDIARVRMRCDPRTMAYVERRTAEGRSRREVERCLVRYIAREVYKALANPASAMAPAQRGAALREARLRAGATPEQVAARLGVCRRTVLRAERGASSSRVIDSYEAIIDELGRRSEKAPGFS